MRTIRVNRRGLFKYSAVDIDLDKVTAVSEEDTNGRYQIYFDDELWIIESPSREKFFKLWTMNK